jgi:hypothetical protein
MRPHIETEQGCRHSCECLQTLLTYADMSIRQHTSYVSRVSTSLWADVCSRMLTYVVYIQKQSKDADARATCRRGTWFFKQDGLWMPLPPAADLSVPAHTHTHTLACGCRCIALLSLSQLIHVWVRAHAAGHSTAHASFVCVRACVCATCIYVCNVYTVFNI